MDTASFPRNLICTDEQLGYTSPGNNFEYSTFETQQPSKTFGVEGSYASKNVNQVEGSLAYPDYHRPLINTQGTGMPVAFNHYPHAFDASAHSRPVIRHEETAPEDLDYVAATPALSSTSIYTDETASPSYSADDDADGESSECSEWTESECNTPSPPCEPLQVDNNQQQGSLPANALLFTPLSSAPFYADGELTPTALIAGTNQWNETWDDASNTPNPVLAQEEQHFGKNYTQNEGSGVNYQHEQPQWTWNSYMPNQENFDQAHGQTYVQEGVAQGTHDVYVEPGLVGGLTDENISAVETWLTSVDPSYNGWQHSNPTKNSSSSSSWGTSTLNLNAPMNYPGEFAATTYYDPQLQMQQPVSGNVTHLHAYGNGLGSTSSAPVVFTNPFASASAEVPQAQLPVNYNMPDMNSAPLSGSNSPNQENQNQFLANVGGHPVLMNLNFGNGTQVHFHYHNHSQK
ncbi:hypothetical protein CVT24_012423 [Panaeolus cyanescens]|uniref:Uncharacterized protein n=1 Tax=Panaeolus cyanescens TaxID=181874 RepID=A0A409YJF5_9AGAR|nr:hypothetical protein CVT24_012423 [Panaeolus cyanescens]